jgi:hypothetical protein
MAEYNAIGEPFGLIYTCNCGWLDRGHASTRSTRPDVGVPSLWNALQLEDGLSDTLDGRREAFLVRYRQDAVKHWLGMNFYPGVTNDYVVARRLSNAQKQQVALAIFQEVSLSFEGLQDSWLARTLTGSDSGFSEEDLVSNLISFYRTLYPKLDVDKLCKPVSVEASRRVWNASGPPGGNKNRTFKPRFHKCDECKTPPAFPKEFQTITPAKKGVHFRDWIPPEYYPPY